MHVISHKNIVMTNFDEEVVAEDVVAEDAPSEEVTEDSTEVAVEEEVAVSTEEQPQATEETV